MNIPLNTVVECLDGLCGRSTRLIVEPSMQQVTCFVLKIDQPPYTEVVVSTQLVSEVLQNLIRVGCSQSELMKMEPFIEINYGQVKVPGLKPVAYVRKAPAAQS